MKRRLVPPAVRLQQKREQLEHRAAIAAARARAAADRIQQFDERQTRAAERSARAAAMRHMRKHGLTPLLEVSE